MSERRYVVQIARAVSDDRIESAADYVAMRLGMDRQRIRTLLAGRTGPVTRPVLADKADSIAEVFTAAGVTVMIMEAPEQEDLGIDAPDPGPGAGGIAVGTVDYEADYDEGFGEERPAPLGEWKVDAAWEAEDDDVPWDEPPALRADHGTDHQVDADPVEDDQLAADTVDDDRVDDDLVYDDAVTADHMGARRVDVAPVNHPAVTEGRDPTEPKLPSTRWVPSPFDVPMDGPAPGFQSEDLKVTWNVRTGSVTGRSTDAGDDHDDGDLGPDTSRPWLTPGRSQFGELSAPTERAPLRTYLMWALVVSVVVLIALQLLFAVRERGAGAATYESGLAAYRSGDFVSARRQWEDVAKTGSADAQYMLGHLVQNGLGQPWSNAQAAVWYRQAADQGLPEAQAALADLYIRGVGVELDLEVGAGWLERAAGSGYGPALYQLAELRLHGRGVAQDFDAALDLFARAAASGSSDASDYVALADHVRNSASSAEVLP